MSLFRRKSTVCEKCKLLSRRARAKDGEIALLNHRIEAAAARLEERDRTIGILSELLQDRREKASPADAAAAMARFQAELAAAEEEDAEPDSELVEGLGGRIRELWGQYDAPPPTTNWLTPPTPHTEPPDDTPEDQPE